MPYSTQWGMYVKGLAGKKSQLQIASEMEMSPTLVQNMWRGRIPESMETVRKYAKAVGVDPDALERRAQLYSSEVYLRAQGDLSDDTIAEILDLINRDKEAANKQRR